MTIRVSSRILPSTYFILVESFPLIHIRDPSHLAVAQGVLDRLLQEDRDEGAEAYLDALTDLVEMYERTHVAIPDASESDVLRELMASNRLSQSALAKAVGISQSTISAILNDTRTMTRGQMTALSKYFGVSTAAFLPA